MSAGQTKRTLRRDATQGGTVIVLGDDGPQVLLGRGEPDAAEVEWIIALLAAQRRGAWLALMTGDYGHHTRPVRLTLLHEVASAPVPFISAAAALERRCLGSLPE